MESGRGMLIGRVFRIKNLLEAKVHYTTDDLTVEEARVLEIIETERPVSKLGIQDG